MHIHKKILITLSITILTVALAFYSVTASQKNKLSADIIDFSSAGLGKAFLIDVANSKSFGWAHPESWGTWGIGYDSKIDIPAEYVPNKTKFRIALLFLDDPKKTKLKIWVNGDYIQNVTSNNSQVIVTNLPARPSEETNSLQIYFRNENPATPKDGTASGDNRLISFGIKSIEFYSN